MDVVDADVSSRCSGAATGQLAAAADRDRDSQPARERAENRTAAVGGWPAMAQRYAKMRWLQYAPITSRPACSTRPCDWPVSVNQIAPLHLQPLLLWQVSLLHCLTLALPAGPFLFTRSHVIQLSFATTAVISPSSIPETHASFNMTGGASASGYTGERQGPHVPAQANWEPAGSCMAASAATRSTIVRPQKPCIRHLACALLPTIHVRCS